MFHPLRVKYPRIICLKSIDMLPKQNIAQCNHVHICGMSYIDSLMEERHNSSALAMELRLFCIKPSICQQRKPSCCTLPISNIDGLVQERDNSNTLAMELHCSCTNPSICCQKCDYYTGITLSVCRSVRLSVCGQNCVRSVSSTILIGSISYLHILSSNFRKCVACNAHFKIQKFKNFGDFFKFVTLTLSSFDLGSNMTQWYG